MQCVQGGIQYFLKKFGDDNISPLNAFKAARLFSLQRIMIYNLRLLISIH